MHIIPLNGILLHASVMYIIRLNGLLLKVSAMFLSKGTDGIY
jgi:hypothetical protein